MATPSIRPAPNPGARATDGNLAGDGLPVLRVGGVDPERGFAGGESQVLGLTLALASAGHHAELLCDPDGQLWQRASAAGIQCRPLRIRKAIGAASGFRLRRLVREHCYDIVHFHTSRAHALAPWIGGRGRHGTVRSVVTRRMDYVPNRLFAPWLYNRAVDGVAAISRAVADALVSAGADRERIALIPSGVDCVRFAPPDPAARHSARQVLGLKADQVAIGTVGMLEERKGHRYLIEAIALARSHGAGGDYLRCFIAGGGSLQAALADQIKAQEAAGVAPGTIQMLGSCDDPYPILAALDIFVMPSLAEGLGVAALEAMACGLPVIASATGGLRDLVVHRASGLLVPLGDASALAQGIVELAGDCKVRTLMGSVGRARVAADFSMEAMARRTLALYRDCLARQL